MRTTKTSSPHRWFCATQRSSPDLVEPAHDDQGKHLQDLQAQLWAVDPSAPDAAAEGHAFLVALSAFFGDLLIHMSDEELRIMPALWRTMSDAELEEVEQRLIASIPPERMARFLRWMIPGSEPPGAGGDAFGNADLGPAPGLRFDPGSGAVGSVTGGRCCTGSRPGRRARRLRKRRGRRNRRRSRRRIIRG